MLGISKRRQVFINSLKLLISVITIYYFIEFLLHKKTPKNQNFTNTSSDNFVCLVNYTCVFSAYYDDITENKPLVRLVGIDNPKTTWNSVKCIYFDSNRKQIGQPYPGTKVKAVTDWNNQCQHSVTFFFCDLEVDRFGTPSYVWLSLNGNLPSILEVHTQLLQIRYPPPEKYKYKVAACVQPLHSKSKFNKFLQVMEWIEYLRLIGVEHFTFYNYKGDPRILQLLETYGSDVVTVLNWDIPVDKGIHVNGQFVAASDCSYRHRGIAKFVLAFDTDEFPILPPGYPNAFEYLENMWETYEKMKGAKVNSVIFNSKFSFLNFPANSTLVSSGNPEYFDLRGALDSLNLPSRPYFLPGGQTKFVYKPECVEESGVHWIDKGVDGTTSINPPPDVAYYFHFRRCGEQFSQPNEILLNNATCKQTEGIQTDYYPALTFGSKLMDAVVKKIYLMSAFNVTKNPDI